MGHREKWVQDRLELDAKHEDKRARISTKSTATMQKSDGITARIPILHIWPEALWCAQFAKGPEAAQAVAKNHVVHGHSIWGIAEQPSAG